MEKKIWIYWDQGWSNCPLVIKKCLATWEQNCSSLEIIKLDKNNLSNFLSLEDEIPDYHTKTLSLTAKSDLIRIILLKKYGGLWVDSTTYCCIPIEEWFHYFSIYSFWAFSKPAPDRLVSSWFLYGEKGSYIISRWYDEVIQFWKNNNSTNEYFWFHKLFNKLYYSDRIFKENWDSTPHVLASESHFFIPYKDNFFRRIEDSYQIQIERHRTPLYKLTYKYDLDQAADNTAIEYLLTENIKHRVPKVLVAWYGSFEKSGTIGDYLAIKSLTQKLNRHGVDFDCLCYKFFDGIEGEIVKIADFNSKKYGILIFCCGPIIKNHGQFERLISQLNHCYKIGLSVSLFPENHANFSNPFHKVFARENSDEIIEDIAILANSDTIIEKKRKTNKIFTIGIVLRNFQAEYGVENCKHEEANQILSSLAQRSFSTSKMIGYIQKLWKKVPNRIVIIDNHLETSGLSPDEIIEEYLTCDLILTTRFHGFIIALQNLIPVIAIDQIVGVGKVYNLVGKTGYPFVWRIEDVNEDVLYKQLLELLKNQKTILVELKKKLVSDSDKGMDKLMFHLADILFSGNNLE